MFFLLGKNTQYSALFHSLLMQMFVKDIYYADYKK